MKLPSANEVMLRINNVALRANGIEAFALFDEMQLNFNRKCGIIIPRKAVSAWKIIT